MKNIYLLLISLLLASVCVPGRAQGLRILKKAQKTMQQGPVQTGKLSHYNGARGSVMGVNYYLARVALQAQTTPALGVEGAAGTVASQRPWIEQTGRDLKAWNLKRQRRERDAALLKAQEEAEELEYQQSIHPKVQPQLAFETPDLTDFIPLSNKPPRPAMPFIAQPGTLAYRGLALAADGESLRNIITNGLRLQDVGEENNTLYMAYASHGGYAAMRHFIENPVINITYGPQSAASWGARRLAPQLPILTVIKIRGEWDGDSLEVSTTDIPPDQLEEIIVRLNIAGHLTWCRLELLPNNHFLLTPYELQTHYVTD